MSNNVVTYLHFHIYLPQPQHNHNATEKSKKDSRKAKAIHPPDSSFATPNSQNPISIHPSIRQRGEKARFSWIRKGLSGGFWEAWRGFRRRSTEGEYEKRNEEEEDDGSGSGAGVGKKGLWKWHGVRKGRIFGKADSEGDRVVEDGY